MLSLRQLSLTVGHSSPRLRVGPGPDMADTSERRGRSLLGSRHPWTLLVMHATPANEQDRAQVQALASVVQEVTGDNVELAFADQGYTGDNALEAAEGQGITLSVVKLPETKRGFCCCQDDRWWSDPLAGWPVSAVWLGVMSAWHHLGRAALRCSCACCSIKPNLSSPIGHNTL